MVGAQVHIVGAGDEVDAHMNDPHDRSQWAPGDRYAIHPAREPFRLETTQGVVYVQPGQYGRFRMTEEGWTVDAE